MKTENEKFHEPRLRPGEVVTIFNNAFGGKEIVEGKAKLVKYCGDAYETLDGARTERWSVRFDNEPASTYIRNVRVSKYKAKARLRAV